MDLAKGKGREPRQCISLKLDGIIWCVIQTQGQLGKIHLRVHVSSLNHAGKPAEPQFLWLHINIQTPQKYS